MAAYNKRIENIATRKAVTSRESLARTMQAIWKREFNPDYDQVVLRISPYPLDGLHKGAPPGGVHR